MNKKNNKYFELIKNDETIFLNFLKAKFPVFHNSNFFFRDFQFGIRKFLEKKGIQVSYSDTEELANMLANHFQNQGLFVPVSSGTWKLNYPEFATKEPGDPF
ncbi:MAG: hypothetical protein WB779_01980 [Ignavibacteriaceae bacterium]|jgi:hypothetical protein